MLLNVLQFVIWGDTIVWRLSCLAAVAVIAGCSLSPLVSNFTVSYNGSIEEVNNQLLLANILRAKYREPLYFSDLSQIRGALTVNVGASLTAPFGEGVLTNTKHFVGVASAGVQIAPTFDVIPLNEQAFTQGIMQPLELQYGKLYWDRADYPEFLLAMLFVDKIEVRYFDENGLPSPLLDEYGNRRPCYPDRGCPGHEGEPDPRIVETAFNQPEDSKAFAYFEHVIANWGVEPSHPRVQRSVTYHGYRRFTPIGEDVGLGMQGGLRDFAGLDPHKFRAVRVLSGETPQEVEPPVSAGAIIPH